MSPRSNFVATFVGGFISTPRRTRGIYQDGDVAVELEVESGTYMVRVADCSAEVTEEHLALFQKIKTGKILPEISYEDPQMGPTRQELEKMLAEAQSELSEREREVEGCLARIAQLEKKRKPGFWRCIPLP